MNNLLTKKITVSILTAIALIQTPTKAQWVTFPIALHNECAERGNASRHPNVINPLHRHKVFCNQPPQTRRALIEPAIADLSKTITLCNWNVYGLPVKKSGRRQKNIANMVAYGCDIFLGQEHWSTLDRRGFRQRTKSLDPNWSFKYFGHPIPVHPGSGIMIGSIWPIEKTQYSPWPGGLFKNAGYKGVGFAQISTPQGRMDVYNLHLAAGRKSSLKEKQIKHLTQFVQETHTPNTPLIITGDFNFNQRWRFPSSKVRAFDWLQEQLGVRSVGFDTRIEHTLLNDQVRYLDHRILADWATPREVYMSKPFIRELADHPGVITRISIKAAYSDQEAE